MKPTTFLLMTGVLTFASATSLAAAAGDDAPPPLPPPPEATDTPPAPTKPATKVPGKPDTAAPSDLPTTEQIQALFDAGNYNNCLKALSRVLPLKGKAAEPYDRLKLLQLKADVHFRLKQQAPAIATPTEAADATDDEPEAVGTR